MDLEKKNSPLKGEREKAMFLKHGLDDLK